MDEKLEKKPAPKKEPLAKNEPPKPRPPKPPRGQKLALLALLLALIAAGIAAGGFFVYKKEMAALSDNVADKSQNLRQLQQQVTNNQTTLQQNLPAQFSQLKTDLAKQQTQLANTNKSLQQVLKVKTNSHADWTLSEVGYLLQLANVNLQTSQQTPVAINLLKAADHRLNELAQPQLQPVRQAIAHNLAALQAVPKVDVAGLSARLNALKKQVPQLPLASVTKTTMPTAEKQPTTAPDKSQPKWKAALNKSWQALQKVIVIRHHREPIKPLLATDQRLLLAQNLQLTLEQAQLALLQREPALYKDNLQRASDWIKEYFSQEAESTQSVLHTLQQLSEVEIKPTMPDISSSLNELNKITAQQQGESLQ